MSLTPIAFVPERIQNFLDDATVTDCENPRDILHHQILRTKSVNEPQVVAKEFRADMGCGTLVVVVAERLARRASNQAIKFTSTKAGISKEMVRIEIIDGALEYRRGREVGAECRARGWVTIDPRHYSKSCLSESFGETAGSGEEIYAGGFLAAPLTPSGMVRDNVARRGQ